MELDDDGADADADAYAYADAALSSEEVDANHRDGVVCMVSFGVVLWLGGRASIACRGNRSSLIHPGRVQVALSTLSVNQP